MADTQILAQQVQATPGDYSPPAGQVITIGAVFAHYDGTAAAGSYVPTLDIISDAGKTILSVVQDSTVAAGTSVEASWAPFLSTKPAATSGAGTLSWAWGEGGAVSSASPIILTYNEDFRTNDAALFTKDGSNFILVHDYGLYMLWSTLGQATAGKSDERFLNTKVDLGDGGGFKDALGLFSYAGVSNVGSAEQFYPTGATWNQYNFGAENGLVEWPNDGFNTPPFKIRLEVNRFFVGSITVDCYTVVTRIGSASS